MRHTFQAGHAPPWQEAEQDKRLQLKASVGTGNNTQSAPQNCILPHYWPYHRPHYLSSCLHDFHSASTTASRLPGGTLTPKNLKPLSAFANKSAQSLASRSFPFVKHFITTSVPLVEVSTSSKDEKYCEYKIVKNRRLVTAI